MMSSSKDKIYDSQQKKIAPFTFNESVVKVFPDMIKRSVPGYEQLIDTLPLIAAQYAKPQTYIYDLGCALGASLLSLRKGINHASCTLIGIDNSEAMLAQCKKNMCFESCDVKHKLINADICKEPLLQSSIVAMNFTLQFIPIEKRSDLLKKIYSSLCSNGVLVLSEKLKYEGQAAQTLETLHLNFKRAHGYSEIEISQKRAALEETLFPETLDQHKARLYEAGFTKIIPLMQYFNFSTILAIK